MFYAFGSLLFHIKIGSGNGNWLVGCWIKANCPLVGPGPTGNEGP